MDMNTGLTASDVALLNNDGMGGWNGMIWLFAILALMGGGFGAWGNNGFANAIGYENLATSNEVQRGFDNQNSMANEREILATVNANSLQGMQNANQNTQYLMNAFNDKYNELQRDIAGVSMMQQQAIANQNDCCCSTKMLIQENRYENAMNTAQIMQAIQADGNATRAMMQQDKIERLQQQVSELQMANQMQGVVRYPNGWTYNAGVAPFCQCNC